MSIVPGNRVSERSARARLAGWLAAAALACETGPEPPVVGASATTGTTMVDASGPPDGTDAEPTGTSSTGEPCVLPDLGAVVECEIGLQDCPAGQKCSLVPGSETIEGVRRCVPLAGDPEPFGAPCANECGVYSGIDGCAAGLACFDGQCRRLCSHHEQYYCASDEVCMLLFEGQGFCYGGCDPLMQDCMAGETCLPSPQDSTSFVCIPEGSGDEGQAWDPCEVSNGCDPGLLCANPEIARECDPTALGCCVPFCDLSSPDCTGKGQACLPWFEPGMAPPGLEDVGVCGVPE